MATINHKIEDIQQVVNIVRSTNMILGDVRDDAKEAFEDYKTVLIATSVIQGSAILALAGSIVYAANKLTK